MTNRNVLVLGAGGMIGGRLVSVLQSSGFSVVAADIQETSSLPNYVQIDLQKSDWDIPPHVENIVFCSSPNYRQDPKILSGFLNGAQNFIRAANDRKIPIVFLSTNHVFDGLSEDPGMDVPTSPICEYGRHKVILENEVKKTSRNSIVRLTKVIGEKAPPFFAWLESLSRGHAIRAFDNLMISPVGIDEVCEAIVRILRNDLNGIFHLSAKGSLSFYEAVALVASELGLNASLIERVRASESEFPRVGRYSGMAVGDSFQKMGIPQPSARETVISLARILSVRFADMRGREL